MNEIWLFLRENWTSLAGIAAFAITILLLIRFGCVKQARAVLLALVIEAEETFGGGHGEVKFSAVAGKLYDKLPAVARILIREKTIASLIEAAVTRMKESLRDSDI